MTKVRTIDVELLRRGQPHNQLLSPLTEYLALCGDQEATTFSVPYEHHAFLREMELLRYRTRDGRITGSSPAGLARIGRTMGELLGQVPGLLAELGGRERPEGTLAHLELVFSAAELALLPFELAKVPSGLPREGKSLFVLHDAPVVVTRRVRSAGGGDGTWPTVPRILFATASPVGAEIPPPLVQAHVQALVAGLEPWTGRPLPASLADETERRQEMRETVSPYLEVLPKATVGAIERACRRRAYTHVHILAHGHESVIGGERSYTLSLEGEGGKLDEVTAERLESALRPCNEGVGSGSGMASPTVVSLAVCDGGNQSQVVQPAASLAHTLHLLGVPLVVASQFPLSFRGSVVMTQALYGGLLAGQDPRQVLWCVRRSLRQLPEEVHDWASLLAYASFPADLEAQVRLATYQVSKTAMEVANRQADRLISCLVDTAGGQELDPGHVEQEIERIERAARTMPTTDGFEVEGVGLLASKDKRIAELWFAFAERLGDDQASTHMARSIHHLEQARRSYTQAERALANHSFERHWVLSQRVILDVVLGNALDLRGWRVAQYLVEMEIAARRSEAWAYSTLLDLWLLASGRGEALGVSEEQVTDNAVRAAASMLDHVGPRYPTVVTVTRRQVRRYEYWWSAASFDGYLREHGKDRGKAWTPGGAVSENARRVLEALPES